MDSVALRSFALAALLLSVPAAFDAYQVNQLGLFLIYGIAAQGVGLLWGKAGILPLGQSIFFGAMAYLSASVLKNVDAPWLLLPSIALGILFIGAIAFLFAAMVFRGRNDSGPYFSLMTLAAVLISEQLAGEATSITGGFNGYGGYPAFMNLDAYGNLYYVIIACAVLSTSVLTWLEKLPASALLSALVDNEQRLQLLGCRTYLVKAAAFAGAAMLAALAGFLFACHQGLVTPSATGFSFSTGLVIWAAVGGRFSVIGPLLGAVVIGLAASMLRDSTQYWELLMAVAFIAVVLKFPEGLVGGFKAAFARFVDRKVSNSPAEPEESVELPEMSKSATPSLLASEGVFSSVGPVRILSGVKLQTPAEGVVSIIGPNGAGKTSFLNAITGNITLSGGTIHLAGERIDGRPSYMASKSGIARKLQVPSIFRSLTVSQNIALSMLAAQGGVRDYFTTRSYLWKSKLLANIMDEPNAPLYGRQLQTAGSLPQGAKQFLEFAMAIASAPRVLLLDEPCAGLSPHETSEMTALVSAFQKQTGALVLMVEHDMAIVAALSDHVFVMHQGEVFASGSYREVKDNPAVQSIYSGGTK